MNTNFELGPAKFQTSYQRQTVFHRFPTKFVITIKAAKNSIYRYFIRYFSAS